MVLKSLMPERAWFSVRGMGVALSVKTSTSLRNWTSRSLWATPKALLFIHHRETQVLEANVLLQQPVGADHDIYVAGLEVRNHFLLFLGRTEAAENLNPDRVGAETFAERGVSAAEQGRWSEPGSPPENRRSRP